MPTHFYQATNGYEMSNLKSQKPQNILGHKAYTMEQIVDILSNTGTYTCPTLPHYRYDRVKRVCKSLSRKGLIEVSGRTEISINFKTTKLFDEWFSAYNNGLTKKYPINWVATNYPKILKHVKKKCYVCKEEYETLNPNQKYCSKQCRRLKNG